MSVPFVRAPGYGRPVEEDVELIGGVEKREIRIVEYDPAWPEHFRAEHERIATALGTTARRIEHVGSTAVPGLAAKPVVDIGVSVPDVAAESTYLGPLQQVGYQLRVREPGHRMLRTSARDVHVHVYDVGSDRERQHLLFRDWLRRDESDRSRYARLKCELAGREWADMNAYAAAKGPLIGEILARAEAWGTFP
ncbi:GrpB family protein [Actinopolyspora halophila]|uniref:GrpB family protein n=1 Tax=Actinopolyspora halophila TaxID=1850 RepID=UPI0003702534|nr:GrpB family protein [Actinopolyspora halophila]